MTIFKVFTNADNENTTETATAVNSTLKDEE